MGGQIKFLLLFHVTIIIIHDINVYKYQYQLIRSRFITGIWIEFRNMKQRRAPLFNFMDM